MSLSPKIFEAFTPQGAVNETPIAARVTHLLEPALDIFSNAAYAGKPLKRHVVLEKEELLEHSTLKSDTGKGTVKQSGHLIPLLGQIHADALAVNNLLEHLPSHEGARVWAGLVGELEEIDVPQDLQACLNQYAKTTKELSSSATPATVESEIKHIRSLEIGQSYLLEGGRKRQKIECPIVYEFIRISATHFDLYAYLPGNDGGTVRERIVEAGKKAWDRPVIYYQSVPDAPLFFAATPSDPKRSFIQAILEARFFRDGSTADMVSLQLLGDLQQYRQELPFWISERSAATDAWAQLKPLVLRKLGKEKYALAILEIKFKSLVQGYQASEKTVGLDTPDSEKLRIVLRRGARLLLKQLAFIHLRKIPQSDSLRLRAHASAVDLLDVLNGMEKAIEKARKGKASLFSLPTINQANLQAKYADTVRKAQEKVLAPVAKKKSIESTRARLIGLPEPQLFSQVLSEYVKHYGGLVKVDHVKVAEIEHLAQLMPIPVDEGTVYWDQIPAAELEKTLEALLTLFKPYRDASKKIYVELNGMQVNVSYTLYTVMHYLALAYDRGLHPDKDASDPMSLAHYALYFPGQGNDHDPYLLFTSQADYKRREEIIAYVKNSHASTQSFDSGLIFEEVERDNYAYGNTQKGLIRYFSALAEDPRFGDQFSLEALGNEWYSLALPFMHPNVRKSLFVSKLANSLDSRNEDRRKNRILIKKGFTHLPLLAEAAMLASIFSQGNKVYERGYLLGICEPNSKIPAVDVGCSLRIFKAAAARLSYDEYNSSKKLFPALGKAYKEIIGPSYYNNHFNQFKSSNTSKLEVEILKKKGDKNSKKSREELTHEVALLRASCEPSLFPHKLLTYFRGRFDLLESFEQQLLFELGLFCPAVIIPQRPGSRKDSEQQEDFNTATRFFPLADEIQQQGFQDQLKLFIQEGVSRFFLRQPNQRPKVLAVTFFLRLAVRLASFNGGRTFVDSAELAEKMLKTPHLTSEERSLLSLHHIHGLSLKSHLKQKEVEDLFGAWVYYKNTPLPEEWQNLLLEKECETVVHRAAQVLSENVNFQKSALKTAVNQLGLQLPSSITVSAKEPHLIRGEGEDKDFWEVNLLTGEVMTADGILRRTTAPGYLITDTFSYIFGSINPSYFETKGCYYFFHPKLGAYRAVKIKKDYNSAFQIQKRVENGWYQYTSPESLNIPYFLRGNRTLWVNIDKTSSDAIICSRSTGEILAKISSKGVIQSKNGNETYWEVGEHPGLAQFERPEYMHWTITNGKSILTLWRYQSHSHNPLSFELVGDKLFYTANRKYYVSQNQKLGLLGATNGSLVLINVETGAEKILAPVQPLIAHTPLSTQHAIDVVDRHITYEKRGELYTQQKGRFEYVELDVKNGVPTPLTQEGRVFLCYHYLPQRKYREALGILKEIEFREGLSKSSRDFITRMIDLASKTDTSPEASAIALHAWILFKRASDRMQGEGKPFDNPPDASQVIAIYSRFEHQISEDLLLNAEERHLCRLTSEGQKSVCAYPEMTRFILTPYRGQQAISPIVPLNDPRHPHVGHALTIGTNIPGVIYEKEIEELKRVVAEATVFISESTPPSNWDKESSLISGWDLAFEQAFFMEAYEIARKRKGTDLDRHHLAYKMHLGAVSSTSNQLKSWPFLQLALNYPNEVPNLPDPRSLKSRYDFVEACAQVSKKYEGHQIQGPQATWTNIASQEGPQRAIKATISQPRKVEATADPLHLFPFSKEVLDQGFTNEVFKDHFVKKPQSKIPDIEAPACPDPALLMEEEKGFEDVIDAAFKDFKPEFEKGKADNAKREFYTVENTKELQGKLETKITDLNSQIADLENSLLELANKHDLSDLKKTYSKAGDVEQELSFRKMADLFMKGDREAFFKASPFLRYQGLIDQMALAYGVPAYPNLVIDYLYNQIGLYMTFCVHRKRLERAVKLCKDIAPLAEADLNRDAFVQKLATELKPLDAPVYSIQDNPSFLVFEYFSGFSIREDQVGPLLQLLSTREGRDLLRYYANRVIQFKMGGGKTALFAVVLLKMAAQIDRLSTFVTPASQYTSVSFNLRKSLRDCFGIDMEEIEVTREQLAVSPTLCDEVLRRLTQTSEKGDFLLIKAETLQTIGLSLIDFIDQAAKDPHDNPELIHKINALKDILIFLRDRGDGLFDEVHLLLHVLLETNFPIGNPEFIAAERIEIIRALFLILTSDKVKISATETVDLNSLTRLRANKQNLMAQEHWRGVIAQAVAYEFSTKVESLKLRLRPDFLESFERYLNRTMDWKLQVLLDKPDEQEIAALNEMRRKDYEFLCYVRKLRQSKTPAEQEAAHQIALVKVMLQTILPVTFEKTGKRNYGRGGSQPGEVRPYHAIDTPSENLFGNYLEAIAYHLQTVLQCGIEKEQLLFNAKTSQELGETHAEKDKVPFDQTLEAIDFKELTGVELHELKVPGKLEEALQNINQNIDALLKFEADTAAELVNYYPLRITGTGQSLLRYFKTKRTMTGTADNHPCYPSYLTKNYEPTLGIKGQIVHTLLTRAATKPEDRTYVHVVKTTTIAELLNEVIAKHAHKDRVRMPMDPGALYKDYSNEEAARAIRDFLGVPVLFFMRNAEKGEKTPDTLAVLRVGSPHPEIIGGTRLEDIEKTGLGLKEYYVYDDERHTTGTDIPLIPNVICPTTVDETMEIGTFCQAIMRARDYFLHQDAELVTPEYLLAILEKFASKQEVTNEEVELILRHLSLFIKNNATKIAEQYYRSVKQKIDDVFREALWKEFLVKRLLTHAEIRDRFPAYRPTAITVQSDMLYDLHGALEYPIDSMQSLRNYRANKLNQFPEQHPSRAKIEAKTEKELKKAEASPYLPKTVYEPGRSNTGSEVNVLAQVKVDLNQDIDQDVDQDLRQELDLYRAVNVGEAKPEKNWSDEEIGNFIKNLEEGKNHDELIELSYLFSPATYRYQKNYYKVFTSGMLVTKSWAFPTEKVAPVFHDVQRPLEEMLVLKTKNGYRVVVLCQKECNQFKSYLERHPKAEFQNNLWLVQPEGTTLQDTRAGPLPMFDAKIQTFLVEAHVFNGRIDLINSLEEAATAWLDEAESKYAPIRRDFLRLKNLDDADQRKYYLKSEVFGAQHVKEKQREHRVRMHAKELDVLTPPEVQAITDVQKMRALPKKQLNMISKGQVLLLRKEQIPSLEEPSLIKAIPQVYAKEILPHQMEHIGANQVLWFKESVTQTQAIPPELCGEMDDEQLKLISTVQFAELRDKAVIKRAVQLNDALRFHISESQVKQNLIENEWIPFIRNKDAIKAVPQDLQDQVPPSLAQKFLNKPAPVVVKAPAAQSESKRSVTQIVLTILGAIVAAGIILVGGFALMGGLWVHAPQFTITLYHSLSSPMILTVSILSVGTLMAVGLVGFAVYQCKKNPPART